MTIAAPLHKDTSGYLKAHNILREIGSFNRVSLGTDNGIILVDDTKVSFRNVSVGWRKQGTIEFTEARDPALYDISVTHISRKRTKVIHSWDNVPVSDFRSLLGDLWR